MTDKEEIDKIKDERDAKRWRKLIRLVGFPQNSSDLTVKLFWDDATLTPFISLKGMTEKTYYTDHGGFNKVIDSIDEIET